MGRGAKITIFILCLILVFAWMIKEKYDISLLAYVEYSMPFTEEEKAHIASMDKLRYGASENSAPLSFVKEKKQRNQGLIIDYISYLADEINMQIENKSLPCSKIIDSLDNNKIDVADLYVSKERNQYLDYSQSIYSLKGVMVTNVENRDIKNLNTAEDKNVAIVEGDYGQEVLKKDKYNLLYVGDIETALDKLMKGKVDAVVGDEMVLEYYIKEKDINSYVKTLNETIYNKAVFLAVDDDHDMLLRILNKGILKLKEQNVLGSIQERWFGTSSLDFNDTSQYTWIPIIFCICLGFVILIYIWDHVLRKQIKRATVEIESQKETLRAIIDTLESNLLVVDQNGEIIESNLEVETLTERKYEEIIGANIDDLQVICDVLDSYKKTSFNPQKYGYTYFDVEIKQISEDLSRNLILCKDVTKNIIAERKLRQENKMTAVGQLSTGLAHEIRNPLGLIRNYKYVIAQYANDEVSKHAIDIIGNSVDRINGLIDNLLKFSRLGNEKSGWLDLNNVINNILLLENKKAEADDILILVDIMNSSKIYSNEETIRIVLFNLINNALEAIAKYDTDKQKKVCVNAWKDDKNLVITVSDNGGGIKEEDIDSIFNPFFTTKENGTGLGLYIVSTELEKVSGTISVRSNRGEETIFKIVIPTELEEVKDEQQ